jgi:hypothetical protein
MSEINDGGPAFPRPFSADDVDADISYPAHTGMTVRDYFAAKAMQGMCAHPYDLAPKGISNMAYKIADEMLKAREK